MTDETVGIVRKQLMLSIDSILESHPRNYPVLWAWCNIITSMMSDTDQRNVELSMEVLNSNLLSLLRNVY